MVENDIYKTLVQAIVNSNVPIAGDVSVVNRGQQLIIPEGMSKRAAREWLKRKEEEEETVVGFNFDIPCYPTDGLIALFRAIKEIYGFAVVSGNNGFFGPTPPEMIDIQTGIDQDGKPIFEQATMTKLEPPMFEGGYIRAFMSDTPSLRIHAEVKQKFSDQVKKIHTKMLEILEKNSIYKGKSVSIDLSFLEEGENFHPIHNAPKFIDVKHINKSDVILNPNVEKQLQNNIFTLIEQSDLCVASGINLKHGCLIYGPYGTGKTLTSNVIAKVSNDHNWTFIYLKTIAQLPQAIEIAKLYAPVVLFAEDFDQVTSGDRDQDLNAILNTLDGIDTKNNPIITILTSNHPEKIQQGCLRPGRIDSVVHLTYPEPETAIRFVKYYCGAFLNPTSDLTEVGQEVSGYVPAFIGEVVKIAKRVAINRLKDGAPKSIVGMVEAQDLIHAARELKSHQEMVNRERSKSESERLAEAIATVTQFTAKFNVAEQVQADVVPRSQIAAIHANVVG
jgi:transitional endoplasmic reticulum ATPase